MRRAGFSAGLFAVALAATAPAALAQQLAQAPEILTIDQNRLYADSLFGQKMLADIDAQTKSLQTENRQLEADLETEEKSLTDRRASLPAAEFHTLAEAFDKKVKAIRTARDAKARDLAQQRDDAQKTFLKTAVPILAEIMKEAGAAAIIDRSAIILSFDRIDITDQAIKRIDATLLPQAVAPAPDAPQPAPAGGG